MGLLGFFGIEAGEMTLSVDSFSDSSLLDRTSSCLAPELTWAFLIAYSMGLESKGFMVFLALRVVAGAFLGSALVGLLVALVVSCWPNARLSN